LRYVLLLSTLFLWTLTLNAQTVHLRYNNQSLDKILIDLQAKYSVNLSFSNNQLSKYTCTVNNDFSNVHDALEFLLIKTPLVVEQFGDVYLIKQGTEKESKTFLLAANIIDKNTRERLPYAHILVNERPLTTNQNGSFSVKCKTDSVFRVKVSYLGFYLCDTVLTASTQHQLELKAISYEIEEININALHSIHKTGEVSKPGAIRLNSFVSNYLPGNGDQSVFNLLRLQPGILAAGEQSSDLLIWGSYEGQSKLILDGITLFSMKNYNDNISTINPLIVKDLSVFKGAYGIDYEGRVGGIVDVSAKDGNRQKFSSSLNVNNQTVNGLASVPLFSKKASLLMAVRQTYYELYDQSRLTLNSGKGENAATERILHPDYNFRDYNLKLSGDFNDKTSYRINYLHGKDRFEYALNLEGKQSNFIYNDSEKNRQSGWSAQINHIWNNGITSRISASGSSLTRNITNEQQAGGGTGGGNGSGGGNSDSSIPSGSAIYQTLLNDKIENHIHEQNIKIETHIPQAENYQIKGFAAWNHHETKYKEDSLNVNIHRLDNKLNRLNLGINNHLTIGKKLDINAGLIYEHILQHNKNYWQPRLSLRYLVDKNLDISLSYGKYTQHVTQLPQIDDFNHIRYFWMTSDFDQIAVQEGTHKVLGFNYKTGGLKFDLNVFQRNTKGLTRFINYEYNSAVYSGKSRSSGFDFLFSQTYRNLNFWIAYTYSKTEEHFDYFETDNFARALHDQRHELKGAAIYRFNKWHFSANYVLGSGFPDLLSNTVLDNYQRLDMAINKTFNLRKLNINTGISILNLLNHKNIKYDNFYRLESDEGDVTLHAEALPFTPTIYLNLTF